MDKYRDYEFYMKEKKKFINNLYATSSPLLLMIKDAINVCDRILEFYNNKEEIDKDLDDIFLAGFNYIYIKISDIEVTLEEIFKNDFMMMNKYARVVNYSIFLNDYRDYLVEEQLNTKQMDNTMDQISYRIKEVVDKKEEVTDELFEEFDLLLASVRHKDDEYHPDYLTFSLIAEDLNAY